MFFPAARDSRALTPIIDTLMYFLQKIHLAMLLSDENCLIILTTKKQK